MILKNSTEERNSAKPLSGSLLCKMKLDQAEVAMGSGVLAFTQPRVWRSKGWV